MKKIVFLIMCLCSVYANSQEGIPFFVNYPASVYQAHNRNFDVVCDSCGNVYFANFEGILVSSTLAVSNIRNRTYTNYEVYLIGYGYGKFKEKIHFME